MQENTQNSALKDLQKISSETREKPEILDLSKQLQATVTASFVIVTGLHRGPDVREMSLNKGQGLETSRYHI